MNLKTIFFVSTIIIIIIAIISCSNNNSETVHKQQRSIKPLNANTAISNSPLPKGAKPLHSLPANVIGYVKKNYPGYSIIIAVSDPLCSGDDAIDLSIIKLNLPDLSLIFKPDGTFVQQEEDVPLNTAPDLIQSILKTKFSNYSAGNQIEKLTLANKTVQYLVDLNNGSVSKEVIFSTEGNVVCEN
ncbi:MAG: PepSY-like domain-containing protein [Bacteroidota bacterium]|nr:PepSY-like domain-containing protein [Bacteroidota bacterium]